MDDFKIFMSKDDLELSKIGVKIRQLVKLTEMIMRQPDIEKRKAHLLEIENLAAQRDTLWAKMVADENAAQVRARFSLLPNAMEGR